MATLFKWSRVLGYDIFLSHRQKDAEAYARKLAERLRQEGFECYLDRDETVGGEELKPSLRRALRKSRYLVVIASATSHESGWMAQEIEAFQGRTGRVIPISVAGVLDDPTLDERTPIGSLKRRVYLRETWDAVRAAEVSSGVVKGILDLRIHRRVRVLSNLITLAVCTALAAAAGWIEIERRRTEHEAAAKAEETKRSLKRAAISKIQFLAREAVSTAIPLERRLRLAGEAYRRSVQFEPDIQLMAEQALRAATFAIGGIRAVRPHDSYYRGDLTLSENRRWLATGLGSDVYVWDLNAGGGVSARRTLDTGLPERPQQKHYGLDLSEDGNTIIAFYTKHAPGFTSPYEDDTTDREALVWNIAGPVVRRATITIPFIDAGSWALSRSGRYLLLGRSLVDLSVTRRRTRTLPGVPPIEAEFSPDERWLIIRQPDTTPDKLSPASTPSSVVLWDLSSEPVRESGRWPVRVSRAKEHRDTTTPVVPGQEWTDVRFTFSPNSQWVVSWSNRSGIPATLQSVNADSSGRQAIYSLSELGHPPSSVVFNSASSLLAIGDTRRALVLYEIPKGNDRLRAHVLSKATLEMEPLWENVLGSVPVVAAIAFSANGRWLATGGRAIKVWDLKSDTPLGDPHFQFGVNDVVDRITFDPTGRWLMSGRQSFLLWDMRMAEPGIAPIAVPAPKIAPVKFTPESSPDHLENVPQDSRNGALSFSNDAFFSENGRWLITLGEDKNQSIDFWVWPIQVPDLLRRASVKAGRNFNDAEWHDLFPGEKYERTFSELPE